MPEYEWFYDLYVYCIRNWKAPLSPKECAIYAYDLMKEVANARQTHVWSDHIEDTFKNLESDGSEEAADMAETLWKAAPYGDLMRIYRELREVK